MNSDDRTLIAAYIDGDKDAFVHLVTRHSPSVYNFVARLSGSPADASDITQEVFIKVWKNVRKYNQNQKFTTWLYSIARYTTIDWLRKRRNIRFSEIDATRDPDAESYESSIVDTEPLAHELFERQEKTDAIDKGLAQLSMDQRTVITLHHAEGLTFAEIAEVMRKSINTVQSHYRRGILKLKDVVVH